MQPLDRDLATYFGLPEKSGVVVNSVSAKSPAERAGLRPGDILTSFGGTSVEAEKEEDLGAFQRLVAHANPGEKIPVEILRDGNQRTLEVEIGTHPKVEPEEEETEVGFHVQEITEILYRTQRLPLRHGAFVSFVARGSPAAEAGLGRGDVIERVEQKKVSNLDEFRQAMEAVEEQARFLLTARRGEETKFFLIKRGSRPALPEPDEEDTGEAAHGPEAP
jgi:serine protease Do